MQDCIELEESESQFGSNYFNSIQNEKNTSKGDMNKISSIQN